MNEDRKPVPPRPATEAAPPAPARDSIPVALVRFDRALQIPGRQSETAIESKEHNNGQSWVVDYLPALRHFRIAYTDRDRKIARVGYVHEIRALSWEPVQ